MDPAFCDLDLRLLAVSFLGWALGMAVIGNKVLIRIQVFSVRAQSVYFSL